MNVKGTAYLARVSYLKQTLGEPAWEQFIAEYAKKVPRFGENVLPTTRIPAQDFVALNDEIVRRFFDGDDQSYWAMGRASGEWGLRQGPYKNFIDSKNYEQFLATGAALWSAYFDAGTLKSWWNAEAHLGEATITGVPIPHVYFEYAVMGYIERALELTGATIRETRRLKGFSRGDDSVHYQFVVA